MYLRRLQKSHDNFAFLRFGEVCDFYVRICLNPDSCTATEWPTRTVDDPSWPFDLYFMTVCVAFVRLDSDDGTVPAIFPVVTNVVHVDVDALFHLIVYFVLDLIIYSTKHVMQTGTHCHYCCLSKIVQDFFPKPEKIRV